MATLDEASREAVFVELEAAWLSRRDPSVVDRLAAAHPGLSEELYEFFADLVLGEREKGELDDLAAGSGTDLMEWLEREGHQIGRDAALAEHGAQPLEVPSATEPPAAAFGVSPSGAKPTQSFLALIEETTDLDSDEIVGPLGPNMTLEFLLATGQHPELYPRSVREELATRAERAFGVPRDACMSAFDYLPTRHLKAASRKQGFGAAPTSFRDLLRRCGLSPEQQMYWISIAHEG